ncbi:SPOR domain-containing protein [Nisaea acidiphila]|uniref:SPOR domain-containing protein n=1 Tax=Nisaea acidiphila TaxID=1862145 RepID=A0A9J7AQR9_9PROT|nr:SPOR domain-containing protein [Nisaea acidiphila]UUX49736.1 SPOR domain-containing protein [Nisaea acidiphila]
MRTLTRRLLPLALITALSACSFEFPDFDFLESEETLPAKEPLAQLPPAPKPLYQPGDTYVFNDDGTVVQEQVVGVTPDRVTWTNDSGLIWTTTNELVTPQLSWSSHPELGRGRQTVIGNPGTLFPLQEGNIVAFGIRGNSEKLPTGWEDELRCVVAGQEDVTVPAGTFTTFRIDCKRKDVETSLYYAPVAQNYVLRERVFSNSRSRKELMSVNLADNRTASMPVTVEQPMHKTDVVNPKIAAADNMPETGATMKMAADDKMSKAEDHGESMPAVDDTKLVMLISRLESVVTKLEAMSDEKMMAPKEMSGEEKMEKSEAAMTAPSKSGKWGIHLESYRTQSGARRGWSALQKRYPKELGGLELKAIEFDAGDGRGTFVRLVAAAFETRADAGKACSALKAKRQYCQAVRIAR